MNKYIVVDLNTGQWMLTDSFKMACSLRESFNNGVIYKLVIDYNGNEV